MIDQDFTKRMTVVVDNELKSWQLLNTVGHITAFLGNKMDCRFDTGEYFETKDSVSYRRNAQYPIIILSTEQEKLRELISALRKTDLLYVVYIPEMVEYTSDEKLMEKVSKKLDQDLTYLGIGLFGDNEKIKELTKQFSLWK